MTASSVKVAQLSAAHIAKLNGLENQLDACVVAYEQDNQFAEISEDQLQQLQAIEQDLGVILLAYDKQIR